MVHVFTKIFNKELNCHSHCFQQQTISPSIRKEKLSVTCHWSFEKRCSKLNSNAIMYHSSKQSWSNWKRSSINSWKKLVRMWYCFSSVWTSYEFNVFDREMKNLNREYRTSSTNSDPSAVGIITIFAQQFRIIPVVGKFRSHNVEEEFNGNVTHSK